MLRAVQTTAEAARTARPGLVRANPRVARYGVAAAVAAAYLIVALTDGGYGATFRAGATIVIWAIVALGLVLRVFPHAPVPRPAIAAGACLAGLAALTALSLLWSSDDGRGFAELVRVLAYLGLFVAVVLVSPEGGARSWLLGLTIGLGAVSLIALGSRLLPSIFPANEVVTALPGSRALLNYPVGYWNGLGACMAAAVTLLTWWGAAASTRLGRVAAIAIVPVSGLVLLLTASRGASLSLAAALAVLVAVGPRRTTLGLGILLGGLGTLVLAVLASLTPHVTRGGADSLARREGLVLLAAALVVVATVALARWLIDGRVEPLVSRRVALAGIALVALAVLVVAGVSLTNFAQPPSATSSGLSGSGGRYQFWQAAMHAFASSPVTGIGAGGFAAWWGEHQTVGLFILDAHSIFIENLAELGLAGLALVVGFFGVTVAAALRARRRDPMNPVCGVALAVLVAGVLQASIDWMWELPAAFILVIVSAALLTGPTIGGRPTEPHSQFGYGVAILLVGWIAILAAASSLVTEVKLTDSQQAVRRGDLSTAESDARSAGALQPWSSAPYLQTALVQQRRSDLPGARASIREAIRRAPDNWQVWLVQARLAAASGDLDRSLQTLSRSNRLRPLAPPLDDDS